MKNEKKYIILKYWKLKELYIPQRNRYFTDRISNYIIKYDNLVFKGTKKKDKTSKTRRNIANIKRVQNFSTNNVS